MGFDINANHQRSQPTPSHCAMYQINSLARSPLSCSRHSSCFNLRLWFPKTQQFSGEYILILYKSIECDSLSTIREMICKKFDGSDHPSGVM